MKLFEASLGVAVAVVMFALFYRAAARGSGWPATSLTQSAQRPVMWSGMQFLQVGRSGAVRSFFTVAIREHALKLQPLFPLSLFLKPLALRWDDVRFDSKAWIGASWEIWCVGSVVIGVPPRLGRRLREAKAQRVGGEFGREGL